MERCRSKKLEDFPYKITKKWRVDDGKYFDAKTPELKGCISCCNHQGSFLK